MKFHETKLQGVYVVEPERFEDERGFFAPSFSEREFHSRGLASRFVENNVSYNPVAGRYVDCITRPLLTVSPNSSVARAVPSLTSLLTCGPLQRRFVSGLA